MSRKTEVAFVMFLAFLTLAAGMAADSAAQDDPPQELGARHEEDRRGGHENYNPAFLVVYLQWNGNWDGGKCITVFPDPAEVYLTTAGKNPKQVRWVVLNKQDGHEWEIYPKTSGDYCVPPKEKKIPKQGANAFKSGPPDDCRKDPTKDKFYDWGYKIKLTDVNLEKSCTLDPGVRVRG